jgi:hypothetical protein
VHREASTEIRQRKRTLTIPAIGCADQIEQRIVLWDGQELSITETPSLRWEISPEHPDFAYVWLTHRFIPPANLRPFGNPLPKYGFKIDRAILPGHAYLGEEESEILEISVCQPVQTWPQGFAAILFEEQGEWLALALPILGWIPPFDAGDIFVRHHFCEFQLYGGGRKAAVFWRPLEVKSSSDIREKRLGIDILEAKSI